MTEQQLQAAQQHEAERPLGIEYVHLNARDIAEHWPAASFDRVTACMSLQDMADVPNIVRAAADVLRANGRFVFPVPHPCTDTPVRE